MALLHLARLALGGAAGAAALATGTGAQDASADAGLGTWRDRVLIEQTLQRYVAGFDSNDPDLFASAFAEDGVFEYNENVFEGRQAIHDFIAERNAGREARAVAGISDPSARLYHVMTNSVITFTGEAAAHHTAYGITIGRTTGETHISSSGSYDDDLVRVDGEWLIRRRVLDQLPKFVPPPIPDPADE